VDTVALHRLLANAREDHTIELKRALPQGRRHLRTLSAFANGVGGTLIVGVTDAGQVVGVHDARVIAQTLRDELRKQVQPPLPAQVTVVTVAPKEPPPAGRRAAAGEVAPPRVVVVRVRPGKEGPYAVRLPGAGWQAYVRENDRTVPLQPSAAEAVAAPDRDRLPDDRLAAEALAWLARSRDATAAGLAKAFNLSSRRATRLLTGFVRAGLAVLHEEPRVKRYALTPQGRKKAGT
jgi:predicted HTH transcriptional regulator